MLEERDLADLHARVERDGQRRDVRELEGQVTGEPGVDEARRRVDQQAEPTERALALDTTDEIVGEPDAARRSTRARTHPGAG
jgi:hypothetical protein